MINIYVQNPLSSRNSYLITNHKKSQKSETKKKDCLKGKKWSKWSADLQLGTWRTPHSSPCGAESSAPPAPEPWTGADHFVLSLSLTPLSPSYLPTVCECCCCNDGDAAWNHTNMHTHTGSSLGVWLSHFCSLLSGVLTVPHLSPFPSLSIHTNTHTVYTKSLPSKRHPHVCLNTRTCVHISSPPSPHWTAFTNNICSLSADAPWGKTNFTVFTW